MVDKVHVGSEPEVDVDAESGDDDKDELTNE